MSKDTDTDTDTDTDKSAKIIQTKVITAVSIDAVNPGKNIHSTLCRHLVKGRDMKKTRLSHLN